jgi:hypothetical protein
MQPYVHIRVGYQKWRSIISQQGGKTPTWFNQSFDIELKNINQMLQIEVMDTLGNMQQVIGQVEKPVKTFAILGGAQAWVEIAHNC